MTDVAAAAGHAQLEKLARLVSARIAARPIAPAKSVAATAAAGHVVPALAEKSARQASALIPALRVVLARNVATMVVVAAAGHVPRANCARQEHVTLLKILAWASPMPGVVTPLPSTGAKTVPSRV